MIKKQKKTKKNKGWATGKNKKKTEGATIKTDAENGIQRKGSQEMIRENAVDMNTAWRHLHGRHAQSMPTFLASLIIKLQCAYFGGVGLISTARPKRRNCLAN